MTKLYVLFEHAVGYALFSVKEFEEVGSLLPQVESSVTDPSKFKQVVNLVGFKPFANTASALANMNAITEGLVTDELTAFLETNIPHSKKKGAFQLGLADPKLGASVSESLGISVTHVGAVPEVIRGIRMHLHHFVKGLTAPNMKQTELGLGHAYSRGKVKFNVNRVDNMIIQSIALIDQMDKDINSFVMRIREWYSYHFPELAKIVTDNYQYAKCVSFIKSKDKLNQESLEGLEKILMDSSKAEAVIEAARMSMGMDISPIDLMNVERFAIKVVRLAEYRMSLLQYLKVKMNFVAPNLSVLIGDLVGARLIAHAGSLAGLAKYPASTVQILGAEKALFRALKTRSNTPKYGLIYHSTFIGRAGMKNKGRISRFLANKCSIASRLDCFSETPTCVFGETLRGQVEERLKFYESGEIPRKNAEVMSLAAEENKLLVAKLQKKKRKEEKRKRKLEAVNLSSVNGELEVDGEADIMERPKKKKKKTLGEESLETEAVLEKPLPEEPAEDELQVNANSVQKKKKKKKKVAKDPGGGEWDPNDTLALDTVFAEPDAVEEASPKKKKKKLKLSATNEVE